jgi:hypothetical protein
MTLALSLAPTRAMLLGIIPQQIETLLLDRATTPLNQQPLNQTGRSTLSSIFELSGATLWMDYTPAGDEVVCAETISIYDDSEVLLLGMHIFRENHDGAAEAFTTFFPLLCRLLAEQDGEHLELEGIQEETHYALESFLSHCMDISGVRNYSIALRPRGKDELYGANCVLVCNVPENF